MRQVQGARQKQNRYANIQVQEYQRSGQQNYQTRLSPNLFTYPLQDDNNLVLFKLQTSRAVFFTHLTIKVYSNRVSLEYRPFIGTWEHRETYNAMDIGDIFINKGRKRAIIGAHRVNSIDILFEVRGLLNYEAEDLKDALDELIGYRFSKTTLVQSIRY